MGSHFPCQWSGNKRKEIKYIMKHLNNLENINLIIEPYCGSSAVSYNISQQYPNKFNYIINDIDKNLIEFYKILQDPDKRDAFQIEVNNIVDTITDKQSYLNLPKSLAQWFIHMKYYNLHAGIYPQNKKHPWPHVDFNRCKIVNFLENENVTILNIEGMDLIEEYQHDDQVFIYVDPPYPESSNDFYASNKGINIYEHFYRNKLEHYSSKILINVDGSWIMNLLFKDYIKEEYIKEYNTSKEIIIDGVKTYYKRKTTHLIIKNY